jgi:hypothetical protein
MQLLNLWFAAARFDSSRPSPGASPASRRTSPSPPSALAVLDTIYSGGTADQKEQDAMTAGLRQQKGDIQVAGEVNGRMRCGPASGSLAERRAGCGTTPRRARGGVAFFGLAKGAAYKEVPRGVGNKEPLGLLTTRLGFAHAVPGRRLTHTAQRLAGSLLARIVDNTGKQAAWRLGPAGRPCRLARPAWARIAMARRAARASAISVCSYAEL